MMVVSYCWVGNTAVFPAINKRNEKKGKYFSCSI